MANIERKSGSRTSIIAMRKIFTVPIQRHLTPAELNGYFERFGTVESIELYTKNDHQFGFIEFNSLVATKMVLSHSIHHISECAFTVNWATGQDSALLNILNDDCLRKIFQYLNLTALSNAADVCVRFNQLAIEAFIANHRQDLVKIDLKNEWSNSKYFRKLDEIEAIFRNFGALIHRLQIKNTCRNNGSRKIFETILLNVASEHIASASLTELHLMGIDFNEKMSNIRPMFEHLKELSLTNCNIKNNDATNFFAACSNLKVLRINRCKLNEGNLDHKFPQLHEFHFIAGAQLEYFHLNELFRLNRTLEKLKLECDEVYSVDFFDLLHQHLPNLTELDIKRRVYAFESLMDRQKIAKSLGRLTALKVLKLNIKTTLILVTILMHEFVENDVRIEHLELFDGCIGDWAISGLSQLKYLKCIKLFNIYDLVDDDIIELAKKLPQLQELHLDCFNITFNGIVNMIAHANQLSYLLFLPRSGFQMGKKNYEKILQSIQERPDKLQLTIQTKRKAVNVHDRVLLANREWLNIHIPIKQRFKNLNLLMRLRNFKLKCLK